jgi:hypothetical protein
MSLGRRASRVFQLVKVPFELISQTYLRGLTRLKDINRSFGLSCAYTRSNGEKLH